MTDAPPGDGWWRAVDGNWYPPERHPNYVAPAPRSPDSSPGHGWWKAADGEWYPPERHPNYVAPSPPSPALPLTPPSATSRMPPPPPTPPHGLGQVSAQTVVQRSEVTQEGFNKLAIGSFIAGLLGCLCIGAPIAIVLGHMAWSQIEASKGEQRGKPMVVMGLVLGYGFLAYFVIFAIYSIATGPK